MKKTRIKRYVIHILAVNGLGNDTVDLPERSAVIFCTKRTGLFLPWLEPWQILHIPFEDYEDRNLPGCFTRTHARMITRFIQGLPDTVTDLYVCCSKGGSRSPAVAAALLRASGRSDMPVWRNPFLCSQHPGLYEALSGIRPAGRLLVDMDTPSYQFQRVQKSTEERKNDEARTLGTLGIIPVRF